MNRTQALSLLKRFEAAFPGQRGNRATHEEYVKILSRFEVEVAEKAVDALIEAKVFWPAVSEVKVECERVARTERRGSSGYLREGVAATARLREISFEEAKRLTIEQFQENAQDDPTGPWRGHIETLEAL